MPKERMGSSSPAPAPEKVSGSPRGRKRRAPRRQPLLEMRKIEVIKEGEELNRLRDYAEALLETCEQLKSLIGDLSAKKLFSDEPEAIAEAQQIFVGRVVDRGDELLEKFEYPLDERFRQDPHDGELIVDLKDHLFGYKVKLRAAFRALKQLDVKSLTTEDFSQHLRDFLHQIQEVEDALNASTLGTFMDQAQDEQELKKQKIVIDNILEEGAKDDDASEVLKTREWISHQPSQPPSLLETQDFGKYIMNNEGEGVHEFKPKWEMPSELKPFSDDLFETVKPYTEQGMRTMRKLIATKEASLALRTKKDKGAWGKTPWGRAVTTLVSRELAYYEERLAQVELLNKLQPLLQKDEEDVRRKVSAMRSMKDQESETYALLEDEIKEINLRLKTHREQIKKINESVVKLFGLLFRARLELENIREGLEEKTEEDKPELVPSLSVNGPEQGRKWYSISGRGLADAAKGAGKVGLFGAMGAGLLSGFSFKPMKWGGDLLEGADDFLGSIFGKSWVDGLPFMGKHHAHREKGKHDRPS